MTGAPGSCLPRGQRGGHLHWPLGPHQSLPRAGAVRSSLPGLAWSASVATFETLASNSLILWKESLRSRGRDSRVQGLTAVI